MCPNHPNTDSVERTRPLGVTLVEVLVSLGILGVLFALVLPAILQTRNSADAISCRARMSQLGRAIHNFEARNQRYSDGIGELKWQFELLPDLDRTDLFRRLQGREDEAAYLGQILLESPIPVLQCPSDSKLASWKHSINFLRNSGSMFYYHAEDLHGVHSYQLRSRDITDGLSMTAYTSEQMNEFRPSGTDRRCIWHTPTFYGLPHELDLFANQCELMPGSNPVGGSEQHGPMTLTQSNGRYDHICRPNHASCFNGVPSSYAYGGFTANSLHSGGVHVLMADGAVRFVNNNVTRVVWRGMGTRDGDETITLP